MQPEPLNRFSPIKDARRSSTRNNINVDDNQDIVNIAEKIDDESDV